MQRTEHLRKRYVNGHAPRQTPIHHTSRMKALLDLAQIIGRILVHKVVEPVGIEQIGVAAPGDAGLAGIVGGLIVLLEFIAVRRSDIILPEFIEDFCIAGRKIVGICCIAAAVLHFLLPKLIVV